MFNEIQKDLLIEARGIIRDERERFICCAINTAVSENADDFMYDMRLSQAAILKKQIESAIDERSCMEVWLFQEIGLYPENLDARAVSIWNDYAASGWKMPLKREVYDEVLRGARLAWLDRALETGSLS
jgi:hypothetical protein